MHSIITSIYFATAPLAASSTPEIEESVPKRLRDSSSFEDTVQSYTAKDFSALVGMRGFSDHALKTHFKLYQGYVTNTNLLLSILQQLSKEGKQRTPQFQEIKRRVGWEYDGIRLHELYFDNLGGNGTSLDPNSSLAKSLSQEFGSFEAWKKDFIETGMLRGIGWVVLYQEPIEGRFLNTWIGEHDIGHLAGGKPILIMDVWEHAYMLDYATDRMAYINAFFENINWNTVSKRAP